MNTIPSLLFEAEFRSPENFKKVFGAFDAKKNPLAGHYQAEGKAWATRCIINDKGHLWLYFWCQNGVECVHSQGDFVQISDEFPSHIDLTTETGATDEGKITSFGHQRFALTIQTVFNGEKRQYMNPVTFSRAPVPFRQKEKESASVRYLGSFTQRVVKGNYVEPIQVWLWQSNEKFLAFYFRQNFSCGSQNNFIAPSFITGERSGELLKLKGSPEGNESLVLNKISDEEIKGEVLFQAKSLEPISLHPNSFFGPDRYSIAPLVNLEETREWLKTISMGYMFSWKARCD